METGPAAEIQKIPNIVSVLALVAVSALAVAATMMLFQKKK